MFGLSAPVLGLISGVGGWISASKAADREAQAKREEREHQFRMAAIKADQEAHDAADKRGMDGGKVNRRFIIFIVFMVGCLGQYIAAWSGFGIVLYDSWETPEWLGGLIPAMKHFSYTNIGRNILINLPVLVDLLYMIGGFYFGSAAGRGK